MESIGESEFYWIGTEVQEGDVGESDETNG